MFLADPEEVGRASLGGAGPFCCTRAMKPGMLSFAEGVGWTYTYVMLIGRELTLRSFRPTLLFEYSSFTPRPLLECRMVLYSPSSSSLTSYNEADGDGLLTGDAMAAGFRDILC